MAIKGEYQRVMVNCGGGSRVEKSHRKKCNINTIVQKALRGIPVASAPGVSYYGDFTSVDDYHSCMNKIQEAKERFQALPSKIRDRFRNDPANLIKFLNNEENLEEAYDLGLVNRPAPPAEEPVEEPVSTPEPV